MPRRALDKQELQIRLLSALQTDCSVPLSSLAKKFGVDPSTLTRMRDELRNSKAIQAERAIVDPHAFGIQIIGFFKLIFVDWPDSATAVARSTTRLTQMPEVQSMFQIGVPPRIEYLVRATAASYEVLEQLVQGWEKEYPIKIERMYSPLCLKDTTELPAPRPESRLASKRKSRR